jgi:predicted dehydrogenase
MGITHFSILDSHSSIKIVAVCNASKTMLSILKKYVDVAVFTDYEKILNEKDLDFLLISTPADSHAEMIKAGIPKKSSIT